jgi:NifU-like protein involved in Fe-S cluster formation
MKLQIKVGADGRIEDALQDLRLRLGHRLGSLVTEVKGKTPDEAATIKNTQIARAVAPAGEDPLLEAEDASPRSRTTRKSIPWKRRVA